jgi:hypothetical protein
MRTQGARTAIGTMALALLVIDPPAPGRGRP